MNRFPLMNGKSLRVAGRDPAVPFRIILGDGRELVVHRLLRVLPGKRIVGEADLNGRRVLAKLFVAEASRRHWQKEREGIEALAAAGIATPELLEAAVLAEGGHVLLTAYLDPAESLADARVNVSQDLAGDAGAVALLTPALNLLAQMHRAGLVQDDLHLGNFLRSEGRLFVIDGDAVRAVSPGKALDAEQRLGNLAILLAQLPPAWDSHQAELLAAYAGSDADCRLPPDLLQQATRRVREWRLKDFLGKTVRDCTLFSVHHTMARFTASVRQAEAMLAPLLADPDKALADGTLLKEGNTCTVGRASSGAGECVIKRYNLKSAGHALTRFWRPSRAWHSWREAHRLCFFGIPTPAPLALVEERLGPFRRRAWLVSAFCTGSNLQAHLHADREPPAVEAKAITALFENLYQLKISHGDLKATNLLWHEGRIYMIDLDAMVQHRTAKTHARAWRRDRSRLLRNWPESSVLHGWLNTHLPPA